MKGEGIEVPDHRKLLIDMDQQQQHNQQPSVAAIVQALLRTLAYAKVQFVRCVALDVGGQVRCKVLPVAYLQKNPGKLLSFSQRQSTTAGSSSSNRSGAIQLVKACIGGLPSFGDVVQTQSGFTAQGTLHFEPDLASLRILPYDCSSALVLGNLWDDAESPRSANPSDLCCRSLLQNVLERARREYQLDVTVMRTRALPSLVHFLELVTSPPHSCHVICIRTYSIRYVLSRQPIVEACAQLSSRIGRCAFPNGQSRVYCILPNSTRSAVL